MSSKRIAHQGPLKAVREAAEHYARTQTADALEALKAAAMRGAEAGASASALSRATSEGVARAEATAAKSAPESSAADVQSAVNYMRRRYPELRDSGEIFSLIFDGKFSDDWTANHRVEVWLVRDFAYHRMPKVLDDKSEHVERELRKILGDNAKVAGFVSNVTATFSTKWSGWKSLSDTERAMKDVLEAAAVLTQDKATLAKAEVTAAQASKVQRVLSDAASSVLRMVASAEEAATKLAPGFVEKIRADPPKAT